MTHKETEELIAKFLNAETTLEEEKRLALEVSRSGVPKEWKIIAVMLGELAIDEALFDHIMAERAVQKRVIRKPSPRNWWWAAAACLLLLVGVGTSWIYHNNRVEESPLMAVAPATAILAEPPISEGYQTPAVTMASETYQDPARVTLFIKELAKVYSADSIRLDCETPKGKDELEIAYLFADDEEQDIIGRLLQVACWYSNRHPGYHLSLNDKQFFFQLKDSRKDIHYQWMAERVRGHILLHCSHTTANSSAFSACYREFRGDIEDNPYIINNHKTKEI